MSDQTHANENWDGTVQEIATSVEDSPVSRKQATDEAASPADRSTDIDRRQRDAGTGSAAGRNVAGRVNGGGDILRCHRGAAKHECCQDG